MSSLNMYEDLHFIKQLIVTAESSYHAYPSDSRYKQVLALKAMYADKFAELREEISRAKIIPFTLVQHLHQVKLG